MRCGLRSVGVWGPGLMDWRSVRALLATGELPAEGLADTTTPKPERIPPRERRRSPLAVKIAVEAASQACDAAGLEPAEAACVFGSGMGDTQITDYMCRALVSEPRLLSPTKFHNSVHNAPSGYWTISTGCHRPANAICAYEYTFPVALLEAAAQCHAEQVPVLVVVQDIRVPRPFEDIMPVSDTFAAALLLDPAGSDLGVAQAAPGETVAWPTLGVEPLERLYATNPSARALALLAGLARGEASVRLPLGPRGGLDLTLGA